MKAAYIEQTGPAANIIYGELPTPEPRGAQVLVKVGAVSVNPIDTYIRNGANYWELPKPYVVGSDLAGTVVATGPDATRFKVGDRVWGSNQGLMGRQGTFAEYCAVDECWLYGTPPGVSDEVVAASALVGITAHLGLFQCARLKAGELLMVNGGAGGVGSMVVQMAKAAGARVIATAGSAAKLAACRELGADLTLNYKTDDIAAHVRSFAPNGVDIFWETTREPNFDAIVP
ncbi:MAG: NADPH:quinone reductase, partial [Planctomycetota bacterium]